LLARRSALSATPAERTPSPFAFLCAFLLALHVLGDCVVTALCHVFVDVLLAFLAFQSHSIRHYVNGFVKVVILIGHGDFPFLCVRTLALGVDLSDATRDRNYNSIPEPEPARSWRLR
jgi:hypothetical protein